MRRSLRGARYYSLVLVTLATLTWAVAQAETLFHFDLPAQSLAETLRAIGATTNTDIGFALNQVAGLVAPPLKADLTVDAALSRVLAGTGFRPKHLNDHTIVIATMGSAASESLHGKATSQNLPDASLSTADSSRTTRNNQPTPPLLLASADSPQLAQNKPVDADNENAKKLEDVVVTGSHLRGVTETGSSVQVITREDIERAGFGTVTELVQAIPQAFGGDVTENTLTSIRGGGGDNIAAGTGIDLRGLGATSTLVLVNGRRLAPSNAQFEGYTDVSNIPLAAIERVEIVPDGASAIYGSDAVAGVVNFILRKDYDGADTRVRYGTVTEGSSREIEANQTIGHVWNTGSALLSYEYYDRTPLSAADRSYTDAAPLPFTLLPQQRRDSLFGTVSERVSSDLELFADGNYSEKSVYQAFTSSDFSFQLPSSSSMYSATIGARVNLPWDYQFTLSTSYAESKISDDIIFDAVPAPETSAHTSVQSTDALLNGSLFALPSGPLSMAIGGQYRRELLNEEDTFSGLPFLNNRDVLAGFTEFSVPLAGLDHTIPGVYRLILTLADRYEHYSDFGSTNNPKVGLVYWPDQFLKLRGSFGRSFRAPSLIDLNPAPTAAGAILNFDPLTGSTKTVVDTFGGNPTLQPEKARTWSFGLDISPELVHGLKAGATYYNIQYTNRIADAADAGYSAANGLSLASILGSKIVQRNPSLAAVSQIAASPNFQNLTGVPGPFDPASVAAILYFNSQNLSEVDTSGIDFNLSYTSKFSYFDLETGLDGTYILKFTNQFEPTTSVSSILNTPYNPIDLRLRLRSIVAIDDVRVGLFVNYVNSYTDNRTMTSAHVPSWTTADMNLTYKFPSLEGLLHGVAISLNIKNLANANPPYVPSNDEYPINFDGTNANPLGRFISLQFAKQW